MNLVLKVLLWIFLNIMIAVTMEFALFTQTTSEMKDKNILLKILSSEFWATIEWIFVIPAQRIGITFLSAPQLALSSYIFNFISQILANSHWLKIPTTIDDYVGMVLIFFGMYASKYIIFG